MFQLIPLAVQAGSRAAPYAMRATRWVSNLKLPAVRRMWTNFASNFNSPVVQNTTR
jgi:hypothetical protein